MFDQSSAWLESSADFKIKVPNKSQKKAEKKRRRTLRLLLSVGQTPHVAAA